MAQDSRRTISRRDLERSDAFDEISPQLGQLDSAAFEELLNEDPDLALELLAQIGSSHRLGTGQAGKAARRTASARSDQDRQG